MEEMERWFNRMHKDRTLKEQEKSRITAEEVTYFRKPAKYILFDDKRNQDIMKELKTQSRPEKINNY
jgi:hypothetical protein